MTDTEMKIIVSMVDKASDGFKAIQGKMDSFSSSATKVGTAMSVTGGLLSSGLLLSVKAAADADKSYQQLRHTTLDVAKASQEQLIALENTADALERKGVLDADNIKMGQAQLMTFGISADMANKLSGSLADLSVNQFGVNASGEDLTQTANMIAKALNGQFGVLEKSGIRFTDAQKQMIQFGNETERTSALQEGLAQNLKYTNDVALNTLEGKLAKANVQFGNMQEAIGFALIPVITQLLEKMQPVIDSVVAWMQDNDELVGKITMVVAAIAAFLITAGPLLLALGQIPAILSVVGAGFTLLANPITWVIVAIGALIAAGVYLYKNWETIKIKIDDFLNKHVELKNALKEGYALIMKMANYIKNDFVKAWEDLKAAVTPYIPQMLELARVIKEYLIIAITYLIEQWNQLMAALEPYLPQIKLLAALIGIALVFAIASVIVQFVALAAAAGVLIVYFIKVVTSVAQLGTAMRAFVSNVISEVLPTVQKIADTFLSTFNTVVNTVGSTLGSIMGTIINFVADAINAISAIPNRIKSAFDSAAQSVKNTFSSISVPGIPHFADGVNNFSGGMALVGERGPELVTLPRGASVIPNSQITNDYHRNQTINVTYNQYGNADIFGQMMVRLKTL